MPLTAAEKRVLWSASLVSPGFPYAWLKPYLKPVARRLRDRGYLRRCRFEEAMRPTARGLAAVHKC